MRLFHRYVLTEFSVMLISLCFLVLKKKIYMGRQIFYCG